MIETAFIVACLAVLAAGGAAALGWVAFLRPRVGLYAILALAPTQFVFIPVGTFFLSPADVIVIACAAGIAAAMVRILGATL